jgi:dihydropteroate synthase
MRLASLGDYTPPESLQLRGRTLDFDQTHVMGVVNVTPDSFSDGGIFYGTDDAVEQALALLDAGASIVDIGGESTRPGAEPVPVSEELERVLPVVERVRSERPDSVISIDTYKAKVAAEAVAAGADIVNDISAMTLDSDMASTVADLGVPIVLMHILGDPKTMQDEPVYDDVVEEVASWLEDRVALAERAGIARSQVVIDPGIGFGKTVDHNYALMANLDRFARTGQAVLLGTSRKSFIGKVVGKPPRERVFGTAATVAWGIMAGAHIVRVHDVAEMVDVARVSDAMRRGHA